MTHLVRANQRPDSWVFHNEFANLQEIERVGESTSMADTGGNLGSSDYLVRNFANVPHTLPGGSMSMGDNMSDMNDGGSSSDVNGNGDPYCDSAASDPDGDGWGYEGGVSCVVRS